MRILTLSDLYWNEESKKLSRYIIRTFDHNAPKKPKKHSSYLFYRNIIDETNPDLVLLGGDITGDGGRHGFHFSLLSLLQYLESKKITTFFIRGNHDVPKSFNYIIKESKKLKYVKYIGSGQIATFNGLSILGLDFQDTENKTKLKGYLSQDITTNIVLSHCQLARRPWLFDFRTEFIITGHYQNHLCEIDGKAFISHGNDIPEDFNYNIIEYNRGKYSIAYCNYNRLRNEILIQKAVKQRSSFKYTYTSSKLERARKGEDINSTPYYRNKMNLILKIKKLGYHKITEAERKQLEGFFYIHGKNLLMDYLGTSIFDRSGWELKRIKILPKYLKDQIRNLPSSENYYNLKFGV